MVTINRVADLEELISSAALKFIDVVAQAQSLNGGVHGDGIARVVLTGGGAGIGMLKELRRLDQAARDQGEDFPALRIDWERIHIFFGDERNVPVSDPDSNEGQAREALLDHVDIPNRHIHGFDLGAISMSSAADAYEEELREYAPQGFDLHLLGMGGGLSSLFGGGVQSNLSGSTVVEKNLDRYTVVMVIIWLACIIGLNLIQAYA